MKKSFKFLSILSAVLTFSSSFAYMGAVNPEEIPQEHVEEYHVQGDEYQDLDSGDVIDFSYETGDLSNVFNPEQIPIDINFRTEAVLITRELDSESIGRLMNYTGSTFLEYCLRKNDDGNVRTFDQMAAVALCDRLWNIRSKFGDYLSGESVSCLCSMSMSVPVLGTEVDAIEKGINVDEVDIHFEPDKLEIFYYFKDKLVYKTVLGSKR